MNCHTKTAKSEWRLTMSLVPMVVEQTGAGERSYDIFSRLLNDRIVMLCDQVTDATASLVIAQMLYLEGKDPEKDIHFYFNSPGGSVILLIQKINPVAPGSKQLHRRRPDPPGPAGDDDG